MQDNFELTLKLSEDPSLEEGDLADFRWLEEITGLKHQGNGNMELPGSGTHYLGPMAFVHNPEMLIMRFNKDVTIQFYGYYYGNDELSGPIPVEIMDGRYGYAMATSPQQSQYVVVTTTETTEASFAGFGDPES